MNQQGQIVINFQFDEAEPFSDERALVKQDGLYGYTDRQGLFVIPPTFKEASSFSDDLALAGGDWGEQKRDYNPFF